MQSMCSAPELLLFHNIPGYRTIKRKNRIMRNEQEPGNVEPRNPGRKVDEEKFLSILRSCGGGGKDHRDMKASL